MEEEKMEQQTTKTQVKSTVGQKVILLLAVIGLVGFGFAIAIVAYDLVTVEEEVVDSISVKFTASTEAEFESKLADAFNDLGVQLTTTEVQSATGDLITFIEDGGDQPDSWGDPRPRCNGCGFGNTGLCIGSVCGSGSYDPWSGSWEVEAQIRF